MKFYPAAAIPLLCCSDAVLESFVSYMKKCDEEPTLTQIFLDIDIPLEIVQEKVPIALRLNKELMKVERIEHKYILKDFLD